MQTATREAPSSKLDHSTAAGYVVTDAEGEIVILFWGLDAASEADTWREMGYRVSELSSGELQEVA